MKFVNGLTDNVLKAKICEQETKGCEETKGLVRSYVATQTLQSGMEKKKADEGHVENNLLDQGYHLLRLPQAKEEKATKTHREEVEREEETTSKEGKEIETAA